jgi:acetyl-CoA acetyltransferase
MAAEQEWVRMATVTGRQTPFREMRRRNVQYGMVTICVGGGMGAAGIFEAIN